MAGIASLARIAVARNFIVFTSQVAGVVVLVAVNATERLEISCRRVAVVAFVPFAVMFSAENGEVRLVVLREIRGGPAGVGVVADRAVGREASRLVVGAGRRLKIVLVAGEAIGRCVHKVPTNVAAVAVVNLVAFCQWEKAVVARPARPHPARTGHIVANPAVGRIPRRLVVGRCRRLVLVEVAVDAVVADAVEADIRLRSVTFPAVRHRMVAEQREAVVKMELRDAVHQPVLRAVAAGAIGAHRLLVQVGVAADAGGLRLLEHERTVAVPTVHDAVFSRQREVRLRMAEALRLAGDDQFFLPPSFRRYLPAFG